MNWTYFATSFAAAMRSILPVCALFFAAHFALAEPVEPPTNIDHGNIETYFDEELWNQEKPEKVLIIKDGEFIIGDDPPVGYFSDLYFLDGIIIEEDGTLTLNPLAMIHVSSGIIDVRGTLIVPSTLGTGIYNSTTENSWDGVDIGDLKPDAETWLRVDGGTVKITQGDLVDPDVFMANTIHVALFEGGGTIDVEGGVVFQSGSITSSNVPLTNNPTKGTLTKTGEGTYQVGTVKMGGAFNVEEGEVVFLNDVIVGDLNSSAGTIISGSSFIDTTGIERKTSLTITEGGKIDANKIVGGKIAGKLTDIGDLNLINGILTFEGGAHDVERIYIGSGATLDITKGTTIRLTSGDAEESYDDMFVAGTLRVASEIGTGIYKRNLGSLDLDPTYITVAGSIDGYTHDEKYNVVGGIIEIYKSDPDSGIPELFFADTLHTQVIGIGKIIVGEGVTFQSGTIGYREDDKGAFVFVSGGGTYQAHNIDIGAGYLWVEDKTTMEFLEEAKAWKLVSEKETVVNAFGDAEFNQVEIAGTYHGGGDDLTIGSNLTIKEGGVITGQISGVGTLTLGGTIFLVIEEGKPILSANSLHALEGTHMRIVAADIGEHNYSKVIQATDTNYEWNDFLKMLDQSQTALYRPEWSSNKEDDEYLDLKLTIHSVKGYVDDIWQQKGQNVKNIGRLLDEVGGNSRYPAFRQYLEGLSDSQLRDSIRNVMAGELAGNAMWVAMQQPSQAVFRHLDDVAPLRSPFTRSRMRGQVREGFNVWFNPYGQAEKADSDGNTFDGYTMSRFGFHLGGDIEIRKNAVFGVLFSYSAPQVKSDLGKIMVNDYKAGLYLRMPTVWEVVANMMVGFGNQDYSHKNAFGKADSYGQSFFASIELSRPVPFSICKLTPIIAVDFQSASMDDFIVRDPNFIGALVVPEDVYSTAIRVGLLGEMGRLRTRLQYMRQVAGDDFVNTRTSLIFDEWAAATDVRSTQWGKDWLNVGIGGELLRTHHWRIFADYDFDVGRRTTSHLGSLNTIFTW